MTKINFNVIDIKELHRMMEDEGIKYIKLIYNCSIEGYTTDIEYIDQDSEKPLTIKFNVKH